MDIGALLTWILVGLIAGVLADMLVKNDRLGLFGDIILGLVGSVVGGFLFSLLGLDAGGFLGSVIVAFIGALVVLGLVNMFYKAAE